MEQLRADVCVRCIDLPTRCKGFTIMDADCFYNIYVNSLLSLDERRKVISHELMHIDKGHFFLDIPTAQKEAEANGN